MSNKNYMIQVDGLRTFAVGFVIFSHYTIEIDHLIGFDHYLGQMGVTLFFVISGFLITSILIGNKENQAQSNGHILRQFYIRRFLRIFPLYYFIIFAGFVLSIPECREQIFWLLTYIPNWLLKTPSGDLHYFSHLWSLGIEEQYYIVFPAIFLFVSHKKTPTLFISMIILGIIARIFIIFWGYHTRQTDQITWVGQRITFCCLDPFGIGGLLAFFKFYYSEKTRLFVNQKRLWIAPLMLSMAACILMMLNEKHVFLWLTGIIFNRLFMALASVWIIAMASYSDFKGILGKILTNKIVVYLGKISYGIYVYHYIVPYFFSGVHPFKSVRVVDFLLLRGSYLLTTILIASISWYLLEKPINDLKRYFSYSPKKEVLS